MRKYIFMKAKGIVKVLPLYLFTFLLLSSCDDFLDTENLTMKDTSNFPINETDAFQMVNGIYSVMNRNLADPEEDPFFVFDIASDDRLGGGSQSNIGAQGVDRLMNAYVDWMKPLWQQRYAGINRANNALETIDNVTGWSNEKTKNQLLCEIHFLRAWYYFNLVQVFNGVPLVLSTEPQNLPRSTPDEVYAQIASDLKSAIEIGPATKYPEVGDGRASKWTAEGMMARVWLFYTGFYGKSELPLAEGGSISKSQVAAWLEDCIQNSGYGLVSDQRNLWPYTNPYTGKDYKYDLDNGLNWETDENKENMFAVKMSNKPGWSADEQLRHNRIVEFYGLRKTTADAFPFSVQGYSNGPVCEKLWTDWAADPDYAGDYRRVGSICDRAVEIPNYKGDKAKEVENTNLLAKKYIGCEAIDPETGQRMLSYGYFYGSENNRQTGLTQSLVWLRFADVLLMHSELTDGKAIYNGKSGLNAVRERAKLPDIAYSLANLKKERRYELCFEALRWNDLRRWGDVAEKVKNQVGNKILNQGIEGEYAFTNDFMARYNETGGGFFKIPEDQVTLSEGVLEQNPGWGDGTNWAKGDLPYRFK
ncbi:SusD family protein [Xylanibacter ruminicola]|uniref:SusD family protein n=1 Tax=Xylanibacter ruminicola TaxID=839 RepID=A0A1H5WL97_XYLRU|nr:RagB/SusD family nutrient uptake outer membrane protein [Xylanibacter ruminicola]SEF99717.1 SusD family protein [Xylanibacter ruminicola]